MISMRLQWFKKNNCLAVTHVSVTTISQCFQMSLPVSETAAELDTNALSTVVAMYTPNRRPRSPTGANRLTSCVPMRYASPLFCIATESAIDDATIVITEMSTLERASSAVDGGCCCKLHAFRVLISFRLGRRRFLQIRFSVDKRVVRLGHVGARFCERVHCGVAHARSIFDVSFRNPNVLGLVFHDRFGRSERIGGLRGALFRFRERGLELLRRLGLRLDANRTSCHLGARIDSHLLRRLVQSRGVTMFVIAHAHGVAQLLGVGSGGL
jgi:hypothetical protein